MPIRKFTPNDRERYYVGKLVGLWGWGDSSVTSVLAFLKTHGLRTDAQPHAKIAGAM